MKLLGLVLCLIVSGCDNSGMTREESEAYVKRMNEIQFKYLEAKATKIYYIENNQR